MGVRRREDRGTRPWVIDFRLAKRRYRIEFDGTKTRQQALDEEARLRTAARLAAARSGDGPTVEEAIERYWTEHGQHLASLRTERSALMMWSSALGHETAIGTVTRDDIARVVGAWRGSLTRGNRPITDSAVNYRIRVLQRLWGRAEDVWGWPLARMPWRRLMAQAPAPRPRALAEDDLSAYLDRLPPRSLLPSLMALHTGLRRGAILRLTRSDMDWQRGVINAVSKGKAGGKPTPVPMTEGVLAVLAMLGRLPQVGALFPVSLGALRLDRERAREAVGIPAFRFHDIRHTFSQMLEDTGGGDTIQDALHHSDPKLRRRYAAARIERVRDAVERAMGARRK